MTLNNILKEFLVYECGFSEYQVSSRFNREVIVYLSGRKLHFIVEDGHIDCCLMRGGMAAPIDHDDIIGTVFPSIDTKNPDSFKIIWGHMNDYLPKSHAPSIIKL